MYNEGISTAGDILDLGVDQEIITKRGSFFTYGELRLGQGRENAKGFLDSNPELMATLDAAIRGNFGLPVNFTPKAGIGLPEVELPELSLFETVEQAA